VLDEAAQIDAFTGRWASRFVEHRAQHARHLRNLALDDCQPLARSGIDSAILPDHLNVARDQIERCSHLVCHVGRHLSDSGESVRACQRRAYSLLQLFAVPDEPSCQ
jgi:hypothetical protein